MPFPEFEKYISGPFKFTFFLFKKLPAAWICGIRLREIGPGHSIVSVPFKWLSQNPFNSIYFACQSMAAEMSTGVLAMGHSFRPKRKVSMLVTQVNGRFLKKATSKVYFTCNNGIEIQNAINATLETGEAKTVVATSTGLNAMGEMISEFTIEWSFKAKL